MLDSVAQALAFYRAPFEHQHLLQPQLVLPPDTEQLLRIAGSSIQENSDFDSAGIRKELQEAAIFFIQQVFFIRDANHYRVLGLNPGADQHRIKEHHRLLIRLFHPDRQYSRDIWAEVYAERVNEAYNVLRKPQSRQSYDYTLATQLNASATISAAASGFTRTPVDPVPVSGVRLPRFLQRNLQQTLLGGSALVAVLFVFSVYLSNHSTSFYSLLAAVWQSPSAMPSSSAGATDKAPDRDFQQAQAPAAPHHEPAGTVNAPNDVVKTSASTGTGTASSTATSILSDLIIAAPVATAAPQKNPDGKITPADESPVAVVALMDSQKSGSVQRQAALQKPAEIETGTDNGNGEPSPEIDRDVATDKPAPAAVSKQKQPAPKSDGNAEKSPALGALSVPPEPSAALQNGHKLAEAVVTPAVKTKTAMAVAAVPAAADKTIRTHPSANAEAKSVSTQTLPAASLPVGATDLAMAKPAAAATRVNPADEGVRRTTFSEVSGVELEVLTSLFVGAYERGNVDELMNLFDEQARANNKKGKTNIRKDYETFFSSTRSREILLRHLRWKRDGRSASGHGLYQVQIQGNQGTQNYTGTIRFEVKKKDKRVLITQLTHKALF